MGVYETERGGFVRRAEFPGDGDYLSANRHTDYLEPQFPLARGLRFIVGVQQQTPAERTTTALHLKYGQPGPVQRVCFAAPPLGPIHDQGGVTVVSRSMFG